MLLIYGDEQALKDAEREDCYRESSKLARELDSRGQYLAAAPLQPTCTATSVRVRHGRALVTDGPFAETREQLGGYFLIDAKDAEQAIAIAARIPMVNRGIVEIRPVVELADLPDAVNQGESTRETSKRPSAANQVVRSEHVDWRPLAEPGVSGVYVKTLRFDLDAGRAPTILLKFDPGAAYPAHNHPGGEEIFVIVGDVRVGTDHLRAGDYLYTAPNKAHAVWSETGCVMLVNVPEQVEILKPRVATVGCDDE